MSKIDCFIHRIPAAVLLVLLLIFAGCGGNENHSPDLLRVVNGDAQNARAGMVCTEELNVLALGAPQHSRLGGNEKRQPAVGIKVRVTPLCSGAEVIPSEGITDRGGNFRCKLKLAEQFGDQYFLVECPDFKDVKPLHIYAVSGVEITGASQETLAGDELLNPIQVKVTDGKRQPAANVPVFFSMKSGPKGAKLSSPRVLTDEAGTASVSMKTVDGYTGKYEILAEIGEGELRTRGIVINALGISRMNLIIGVLGGLGLFIFGMTMMSDGLQQIAGDKLKSVLQMFTSNKTKAMLAGLVVTAMIQSSSATTVMVVGFVNASLLNLTQAIGIILGASIGTTVTAQMVSLKLDSLALPAIIVGVLCALFAKRTQSKGIASTILGFGLLFYGMIIMSSQLKTTAEFPTFISFFNKFDCTPVDGGFAPPILPVLGAILVGVVMTVIVQSSSATVGLAIALADSGLLNFYTAVPLIIGDNIGTTITGQLAAINTNRASRQAALAATVIKILGGVIIVPLLYVPWHDRPWFMHLVDIVTAGDVFSQVPENIGRHLASAHTLFNVINVIIFLPFINVLEAISKFMVPGKEVEQPDSGVLYPLEERLLNTPSAALSQVLTAMITMAEAAMDLTGKTVAAMLTPDSAISDEDVEKIESRIDDTQHSIIDYLVMLTRHNLNIAQSNAIPIFMHCVNDAERIGDRAVNIYELLPSLKLKNITFSPSAVKEIQEINVHLDKMIETLIAGFWSRNMSVIQKVVIMDAEVKRMTARFERSHEVRLKEQDCTVEKGLVFVELLANLERISAHLTNIAERAGELLPHSVNFNTRA